MEATVQNLVSKRPPNGLPREIKFEQVKDWEPDSVLSTFNIDYLVFRVIPNCIFFRSFGKVNLSNKMIRLNVFESISGFDGTFNSYFDNKNI